MAKTAKEAPEPAPAPAGAAGEIYSVRGPEDGRWRAGLKFGPTPVEIDLGAITAEQWAQIEADDYLVKTKAQAPAKSQSETN